MIPLLRLIFGQEGRRQPILMLTWAVLCHNCQLWHRYSKTGYSRQMTGSETVSVWSWQYPCCAEENEALTIGDIEELFDGIANW